MLLLFQVLAFHMCFFPENILYSQDGADSAKAFGTKQRQKKICLPAAATLLKECTKHQTNEFFSCFLDRSSLSSLGDGSDNDKLWCNP